MAVIPCLLMRGGTSKGPFFLATDLPQDTALRDRVLLSVMGSPDVRQIDGIGGADTLTSKVAIISPSSRPGIDVEYLFAQVSVDAAKVDTSPNCGNMLAGVGPFAILRGLVQAADPVTTVRIFNVNTGKVIEALVPTPGGEVTFDGDARIDGVPGTGAPIVLNFLDAAGALTGRLLPTGNVVDVIDGIEVTCVDFSMPVVFMAAASLGKTGYETKQELDADKALLNRLEAIRCEAGRRMGLGDVSQRVVPKVVLTAPPRKGGTISSRYFVPWNCHAAHAVTGALCVAAATYLPDSVAARDARPDSARPGAIAVEHPSGQLEAQVTLKGYTASGMPEIERVGIIRTARLLFSGEVYVHGHVMGGRQEC